MQNLDPKEQFLWGVGLGLVWFCVWGFGSNQGSLLLGNNSHQSSLCSCLCVVGCGLLVGAYGVVLFCCFFIWLSTREKKKNARRWWVRERREEKRREEEEEEEEKERKKEDKGGP